MADVRITGISVPDAPEQYDRRNEADFRRVVLGLKDEIDNVLQRLKTAARDGVVFTTTNQTIAGVKTFDDAMFITDDLTVSQDLSANNDSVRTEGTTTKILTVQAGSTGAQLRFNSEADDLRWIFVLDDDDDDGDNDGGNLRIAARNDAGAAIGDALTFDRATMDATFGGALTVTDDLTVTGDILPQGNIDLNVAGRIYARGSTFAPGNGNEFDGVFALGAGARVYLAALQYTVDNDQNSLRIYTHPSGTGADPSVLTAEFRGDPASGNTALFIQHRAGGTLQFEQVSVGATDSGGSGFRVLRIPN